MFTSDRSVRFQIGMLIPVSTMFSTETMNIERQSEQRFCFPEYALEKSKTIILSEELLEYLSRYSPNEFVVAKWGKALRIALDNKLVTNGIYCAQKRLNAVFLDNFLLSVSQTIQKGSRSANPIG